ncbi:MAG: DUF2469 domain-containing protein [Bifidobacteriaceae bacterium]|jgi:hypothetical protein|nr:DUF2469 domain-containing protein [Bifidobacteriaceae bacterium]
MSADTPEAFANQLELQLYREYQQVVGSFKYVVETDRRFYLANHADLKVCNERADVYYELTLSDAWVWDIFRPNRFVKSVQVLTFRDVNIEEQDNSRA